MKKVLLLFTVLIVSVMTTACINNLAIQELNNKAAEYMDKGDTETAICRLKSSLDLDNEVYQTHYNLAVAYNNTGEYENSLEECKKVLELKPDFYDAYYTMATAKEAIAYNAIEKENLTQDDIDKFNNLAQDAVDTYNEYLVKKIDAEDTEQINNKINELNEKIKEYTQIYEKTNQQIQTQTSKEVSGENTETENGASVQ